MVTRKGKLLEGYRILCRYGKRQLTEFFYNVSGRKAILPALSIITIGKKCIVEDEGAVKNMEAEATPSVKKETGNFSMGDDGSSVEEVPAVEKSNNSFAALSSAAERDLLISEPKGDPDPAEIFVQRQRQYLIGKTLLKDFKLNDGEVIAWENQVITEELFDRLPAGRSKAYGTGYVCKRINRGK